MSKHTRRCSRIPPFLGVGATAMLALMSQSASAQAFAAAKTSLADYTKAKLAPRTDCAALNQYAAKDLLQITAAAAAATPGVPAYCKVTGVLAPEIAFEVSLPANWNGRFYMIGNGGHAGESMEDPGRVVATQCCAASRLRVRADQHRP